MRHSFLSVIVLFLFVSISLVQSAETEKKIDILIMFDCSKHMSARWEDSSRFDIARAAIEETFDKATQSASWGLNVGIRVFGDQSPSEKHDCEDTRLATAIEWLDPTTLRGVLQGLKPRGVCNVGKAIENATRDFLRAPSIGNRNGMLIVLSHADECNGDMAAMIKNIKEDKLTSGALSVLGIHMDPKEASELKAVLDTLNVPYINTQKKAEVSEAVARLFNELAQIAPRL